MLYGRGVQPAGRMWPQRVWHVAEERLEGHLDCRTSTDKSSKFTYVGMPGMLCKYSSHGSLH